MSEDFMLFLAVGFFAQLVDGALGMAYGVTATTFMLAAGVPPAQASAATHAAEVFTTAASGGSHMAHRNVDWPLFWRLAPAGMIGGAAGAFLLTSLEGDLIRPFIFTYLAAMGIYILFRAFRPVAHGRLKMSLVPPLGIAACHGTSAPNMPEELAWQQHLRSQVRRPRAARASQLHCIPGRNRRGLLRSRFRSLQVGMPPSRTPVQPPVEYAQFLEELRKGRVKQDVGSNEPVALLFVFLAFGSALGLGTASSAPTWRDASVALAILSGVYLVLAALLSFALGGYVAGRFRSRSGLYAPQPEFYAGVRGLLTWGLAVLLGALITLAAAQALRPAAVSATGNAGATSSAGGEGLISYELDRLFRADRRPADADVTYPRAEAARILLTSSGHSGMAAEDRAYLTTLTRNVTGLAQPDAERRVGVAVVRAREAISRARKLTVLIGFMTAVSLLLGAVVSWLASERGERDGRGLDTAEVGSWFKTQPAAAASGATGSGKSE